MVTVVADATPLKRTFQKLVSLSRTTKIPLKVVNRFLDAGFNAGAFEFEQQFAKRASKLTIRIKAGKRLLELLAALRTGTGKFAHRSTPHQ